MALKRLGCLNGNSTISLINANCFRQPPRSSYPIKGKGGDISRNYNMKNFFFKFLGLFSFTYGVQSIFFIFPLDWFSFTMNNCVWSHYTKWSRIGFNDFKFDRSHCTSNNKSVSFVDGPVSLQEIRLEIDFKPVSS